MSKRLRFALAALFVVSLILFTAPNASAAIGVSAINYSTSSGILSGYSATFEDWDFDFSYCFVEEWDGWYQQWYCAQPNYYSFWVSVDAYLAPPSGGFAHIGSYGYDGAAAVGYALYPGEYGTWTGQGGHTLLRDWFSQNCYSADPWDCTPSFFVTTHWFVLLATLVEAQAPPPAIAIQINSTADQDDDVTVVNPQQAIPIRLTLTNASGPVSISVSPPDRGTVNLASINLTDGVPVVLVFTPTTVSAGANDVIISVSFGGTVLATEDMTVVNVSFPAIRAASTPAGMVDRIPPRVDTPVSITVQPDLSSTGQRVTIAKLNTGGNNGDFSLNGAATVTLATTGNVNFSGTVQTSVGPGMPGQYAGNLRVVAQVRGQNTLQSPGFSVAAIPIRVNAEYNGPWSPVFDGVYGIQVKVTVDSDSGDIADLLGGSVEFRERLELGPSNGSLSGIASVPTGYGAVTVAPKFDDHTTGVALVTGPGESLTKQLHQFRDFRTGAADMPIAESGFTIYRQITGAGPFTVVTRKLPDATTVGMQTVAAGTRIGPALLEVTQ